MHVDVRLEEQGLVAEHESMRQRADELLRSHPLGDSGGVTAELGRVCCVVCEDLSLLGAALTLMPGLDAHAVAAASSTPTRRLEEAQFGVGTGPTRDAFDTRRPVLISDLERSGPLRWPGWVPMALDAGVAAVYAFPLLIGATNFGVLTLYVGGATATLDAQGLTTALVYSQIATEILLDGPGSGDLRHLQPDLDVVLETHAHVYQAQGMLMVDLGISLPEALARMRAHAWATGQDLTTLAGEIVAGQTRLPRDDY